MSVKESRRLFADPEGAALKAVRAEYHRRGWWGDQSVAEIVTGHSRMKPEQSAFLAADLRLTWAEYEMWSRRLAAVLTHPKPWGAGVLPGSRVAVWLPDTPTVHVAFLAVERAGAVIVGIGARAGDRELCHILKKTKATTIITFASHRGRNLEEVVPDLRTAADCPDACHVIVPEFSVESGLDPGALIVDGLTVDPHAIESGAEAPLSTHRASPDDLWLINSTSGTTGLPKCVMHNQNRWLYFHKLAVDAGALTDHDVFLTGLPAPFGFGIWTGHVTPTVLGSTCVLLDRFRVDDLLRAIQNFHVTVLSCVSSQFLMMLNSPNLPSFDLSSLRVMFTGGEPVPFLRAAEFEERTGAKVLQFFGSNETGALSATSVHDSRDRRLRTSGRVLPDMQVRLYDEFGNDVTIQGRGIPAGRGPATCLGYLDDEQANYELFTSDGWMLQGDIVEIDKAGYLTLVGRTSDIIIRGGKNISAALVEADVMTHPAVAVAAVIPTPDEVLGERVCACVEVRPGHTLTLAGLIDHLTVRGISVEYLPERLEILDELPRSSGGKIAKGELRARIQAGRPLEEETRLQN